VNILFVNYGDFTTNSLNHIAGFANGLCARGHACAVAVPKGRDTLGVIADPLFIPAVFDEVLARPRLFPNGAPADIVHAWTPREPVRRFLIELQRRAPSRLVVHLEDNEDYLTQAYSGRSAAQLRELDDEALAKILPDGLAHPVRYRNLLRVCDAVTHIVDSLAAVVPPGVPARLLPPGVDFSAYGPREADPALRASLGLAPGEKVIVFTGSNTFANEPEMRDLYLAVKLLNQRGIATRLVRTGFNSDAFKASLAFDWEKHVVDLGFVEKSRLPALLALADALVQPGRAGPFNDYRLPSKLPEFLAMGRPVILPDSNVARLMRDGEHALFLRSGSPEEIADACARVFSDPALAGRLSKGGAAFAREHFDLAAAVPGLESFYGELAARPVHPRWAGARAPGVSETSLAASALAGSLAAAGDPGAAPAADLALLSARMEASLAATRDGLRVSEAELAACRTKLSRSEEGFRLSRQHAANLENLRRELVKRVQELDVQCAHLTRTIHALEEQARQRDEKLRRLQASFSWRSTSFLRFLRRLLFDPKRPDPKPAAAPKAEPPQAAGAAAPDQAEDPLFVRSVDYPQSWSFRPRTIPMRGWCFAEDGTKLTAVRAVLPGRVVEGVYGLKRLDVLASAREKPQAEYCGWRIDLPVTVEDRLLDIEVRDESGTWRRFFHTGLRVGEDCGPPDLTSYEEWIRAYDQPTEEGLRIQAGEAAALPRQPLFSVLMPVYNPPLEALDKAIRSVRAQTYARWELCIADDASPDAGVRALIERHRSEEPRIKAAFRPRNGHICAASNSALELATGDYVTLLDHDDALAPNALYEFARVIAESPDVDFLYSDEDKIDEDDRRFEPYFKPDFLPDLFLAQNYTSHLSAYRASIVRDVGGFREGFEGSQDWDLALRVFERTDTTRIRHIPRVLYHWRAIPGSTALMLSEKNYPLEAARRALEDHFSRRGLRVELSPVPGDHWRVRYPLPAQPPLVSLVIPTRNALALLERCVGSILEKTTYPRFEVLVVDNGSDDPPTLRYLESLQQQWGGFPGVSSGAAPARTVRVLRYDRPFNYSAINNHAVREARGAVVGLLNNDLEVITPGWLDEMVSQALRPGIGCVGAMLYYPNDTIQHAGSIIGLGGVAGHAFLAFPRGTEGRFNRARLVQNYSAVTAACLVVRKAVYDQVGGLDEVDLAVAFNDVDFCLKVREAGYQNLWTPFAEFYHHESASRGTDDTPEKEDRFRREVEVMMLRWGPLLQGDPAYNPNLSLETNDFGLASPPRLGPSFPR
jgi:glycosyltransferase involved in cell wall biosynthesis